MAAERRADSAVAELENERGRAREAERALVLAEQQQRQHAVQYQQTGGSGATWFDKIKADPSATYYMAVVALVTLLLLWFYVRQRE